MANDQMLSGPHGSPLQESLGPILYKDFLFDVAAATAVTWSPFAGMEYEVVGCSVVTEELNDTDTTAITVKAGNSGDDDGYFTAKTIPTDVAAGTNYSTFDGTLVKGALFAAPTASASRVKVSTPLVITPTAGADPGTAAGDYRVTVILRPLTGPFPAYNTSI